MRIVIVGGGKTGAYLAGELKKEHAVTLLEQREERVVWLRSALPDIEIIEGDACEPLVLEGAGAPKADLVVAVTGDDEDNLVVAMLAKVLSETTKVYARVNHPRNQWLFDKEWGVDVAVSSPAVLYGLIGKDLGLGDIVTLLNLQDEDMSVREIRLPDNARAVGSTLADIALPSNVTVMAILAAGGGVRAARGETTLDGGDQLLLLFEGEIDQQAIRDALGVVEEVCTDEDEAGAH
ncbi:MAG TPA: NAD-binding protein [Coriobacteriia bacterium]|nr:NAD-binding protein [Coriobacteriia bacterium]